ncbi:hypothetical protein BH762_gp079 [Gordonia phage OneUp]|uniref:Uncharacterized protein n=1 Tax=Gordonia phage OneUp TaxID=1838074 RepID=A0A160DET2_9CAUD|nr:hypothetical protein BH762_gp079 [Gordonia phage OneUp]ANA86440.1 hypothetical protein PBI_ONEUP_106 [Gordonia phage OneUp]
MSELGQKLISEIRVLATENPDRVAECKYFEDGDARTEPCCIVGHAAHNLGVSHLLVKEAETDSMWGSWNLREITELPIAEELSESERKWIDLVQSNQDRKDRWEFAVEAADEEVGEM